jgi:N-acetylneuraminic acid mutarotase
VAKLPVALDNAAAATGSDGRTYVIGGAGNASGILPDVNAYAPSSNSWSAAAPLPNGRYGLAGSRDAAGNIYVVGGYAGGSQVATTTLYHPSTNSWTTLPNMPTVRDLLGVAVAPDGRVYAIGGDNGTGTTYNALNTVEIYTP